MRFDEPTGTRADVAFELLSQGQAVSFQGLQLQMASSGELVCRVFTQWHPENVNSAIARNEFAIGLDTLTHLFSASQQFAALGERPCRWELLWDYGMGAIRLCSIHDGLLVWGKGYPKASEPAWRGP